jgi:hypothetical protein
MWVRYPIHAVSSHEWDRASCDPSSRPQWRPPRICSCRCLFTLVILSERSESKDPRICRCRCLFPTNTLATCNPQLSLSSPSTPENPSNPHRNNHLPPKNSWHTSYARLGRINVWIESEVVILAQPRSCHSDPEAQPKVEESPYWVCFAAALQGLATSRS